MYYSWQIVFSQDIILNDSVRIPFHFQQVLHENVSDECTVLDTSFSVRILFSMIAIEFACISSKPCMRIFLVNVMLRSLIPLMLETKDTFFDTLFSVRILFLMTVLEFHSILSKSRMRLSPVNITLSIWILLTLKSIYTFLDTSFSVRILFLKIALEFHSIFSKCCMRMFRMNVLFFKHCFQSGYYFQWER